MIKITLGKGHADSTYDYIVETDAISVGDFIREWLQTHPYDWGYFRIRFPESSTPFGDLKCEYRYGVLISELPYKYLLAKICNVSGSGGYSLSDFTFDIDRS